MNYPIVWLVLLIVFAGIEGATAGLVSIWFCAGSLVALFAAWLNAGLMVQIGLFAIVSVLTMAILRPMAGKWMKTTPEKTNADRIRAMSDEELAEGLLTLAKNGATLCDVIGDLYSPHPEELTDDAEAIRKQMNLIEKLHERGAQVLMSSHILKHTPAERVLEVAAEQKRRGADVIKIVTGAKTMEEQIENLRITTLLKKELGAPFLFLSGGTCSLHRRLGLKLGCCMALCVYEHDAFSTASQPLLSTMKAIRDEIDF